jgi:hypothetical protein
MYYGRVVIGVCIWIAAFIGCWLAVRSTYGDTATSVHWSSLLVSYMTQSRERVVLEFAGPTYVGIGDPIFAVDADGPRQIGEIAAIDVPNASEPLYFATVTKAEATFYASAPLLRSGARLEYREASSSLAGVVTTLLPPAKRAQILQMLGEALQQHENEIVATFQPLLVDTISDAATGLEEDLAAAVARHRKELDDLGAKYHREIVEAEIVPLMRDVLLPIVRHRVEPVANQVGLELWQRASLWRFGWRYLYDTLPIMNNSLLEAEWKRFLSEEAAPIIEKHADEIVEALGQVTSDAISDEQVRQVLKSSFSKVATDPEFQQTMGTIFREVIVDNPRMRKVFADNWSGARFQNALSKVASSLEPTFRKIGEIVLGTREAGITPELARVLRQQILGKDRRWFVLMQDDQAAASAANVLPVIQPQTEAVWPPLPKESSVP